VQFENGQEQVIRNLDRTLTGHETLSLDLDGDRRTIRRVVGLWQRDQPWLARHRRCVRPRRRGAGAED
jgi:hypothetical protein